MDKTEMDAALNQWRRTQAPEALGELLKAQRNRAFSVAARLTGSQTDAEDVVQQAFIKLLSRTSGFEDAEAFDLAVYRAVVQCGLDAIRQRKRRLTHETELQASTGDQPVGQPSPSEKEERNEVLALLHGAVAELPDDERAPVVLCYYQGLSASQTARTLELPRETVRARLGRALNHLRRTLTRNGKKASAGLILTLLWQDGALAAPASLCQTLDQALPGRPCGQIPALAQPGPAATAAVMAGAGTLAAAVVLAAAIGSAAFMFSRNPATESETQALNQPVVAGVVPGAQKMDGRSSVDAPPPPPAVGKEKEEQVMKSKLAALAVMGGLLAPGAIMAGEGNAEVAKTIAAIEARRVAKAEAAAKANTDRAGFGEKNGWTGPQSGSPGAGGTMINVNPIGGSR